MLVCPFCAADDLIEGDDVCGHCQQPLTDAFIRVPASSVEADLLHDLVRDLPHHEPIVVGADSTVGETLHLMVERSVGCVLVVVDDRLAGIFSERDALLRLGPEGVDLHDDPIVKYMTPNPAVVASDDKIAFAIHKMDLGGYRHLPILEGHRAVGLISIRDVLRYLTEHNRPRR
ncbi:CBS domain-containing protein [Botrimarina sp.]|uniref:CBS domain-containing protein n=1 Tax=Botrimarina sp. TaxID=2795802 RepID=UPI0032EB8F51